MTSIGATTKAEVSKEVPSTPTVTAVPATPEPTATPAPLPPAPTYTEDDLFCMAVGIYQEAGGDGSSDQARVYVGSVILNRRDYGYWGNTIRDVLEAPGQYGRLSTTGIQFPERASRPSEQHAVARAYEIAKQVLTNGSSLPELYIWQAEFVQGKQAYPGDYIYLDGMYYCHN